MRRSVLFVSAALALAGSAETASVPGFAVRASAGLRIDEYDAPPAAAQALMVAPEPIFRHGHRPGDHAFARIAYGVLLPQGGAAVVDVGATALAGQDILLFGEDGALRKVLARGGGGPAEMRHVAGAGRLQWELLHVADDDAKNVTATFTRKKAAMLGIILRAEQRNVTGGGIEHVYAAVG